MTTDHSAVTLTEGEREPLRGLGQGQVPAAVERIIAARLAEQAAEHVHQIEACAATYADLAAKVARVEALVAEFRSEVDWSDGRWDYGDNAAWESAADRLRAALDGGES